MKKTTASSLLAAVGAVLLLGQAAPAVAADAVPVTNLQPTQVGPALGALGHAVTPVEDLRLDPFANSAADPLDNAVAVQPDNPGMRPVSTTSLTGALSNGGGAKDLLHSVLPH